jgi:hypothetical protein
MEKSACRFQCVVSMLAEGRRVCQLWLRTCGRMVTLRGAVDGCVPWPGSGRATCKKESAAMMGQAAALQWAMKMQRERICGGGDGGSRYLDIRICPADGGWIFRCLGIPTLGPLGPLRLAASRATQPLSPPHRPPNFFSFWRASSVSSQIIPQLHACSERSDMILERTPESGSIQELSHFPCNRSTHSKP